MKKIIIDTKREYNLSLGFGKSLLFASFIILNSAAIISKYSSSTKLVCVSIICFVYGFFYFLYGKMKDR